MWLPLSAAILLSASLLSAQSAPIKQTGVDEEAGAVLVYLNSRSTNRLLNTALPVLSYMYVRDQTFNMQVQKSSFWYGFTLDGIHVNDVEVNKKKLFELGAPPEMRATPSKDGNSLHLVIEGVDLDLDLVNFKFMPLNILPVQVAGLTTTNLRLDVTFQASQTSPSQWDVAQLTHLDYDDFEIYMDNYFLDNFLSLLKQWYNDAIRMFTDKVNDLIDVQLDRLNHKLADLADPDRMTFHFNQWGIDSMFNATPIHAPIIQPEKELVTIALNGLFTPGKADRVGHDGAAMMTRNTKRRAQPPHFNNSHAQQVWVHQSMLNSVIMRDGMQLFPMHLSDANISAKLHEEFSEIKSVYGEDVNLSIEVSIAPNVEVEPIHLSQEHGMVFGDKDKFENRVKVLCQRADSGEQEVCVEFSLFYEVFIEFWMQDWNVHLRIKDIKLHDIAIRRDLINISDRNFEESVQRLLLHHASEFNFKYYKEKGQPIGFFRPEARFVGGILKNATLSPFLKDEWFYFGFSMYQDYLEWQNANKKKGPVHHHVVKPTVHDEEQEHHLNFLDELTI